jgi:sialic acid synthase SpsE
MRVTPRTAPEASTKGGVGPAGSPTAEYSAVLDPRALAAVRREAGEGLAFIAAPHDLEAVKIARELEPDAYQIDAEVLGNPDVVRAVAKLRRPVLVVAGACTDSVIEAVLTELARVDVVILHAVTALPLPTNSLRLGYLGSYRERYQRPVGYLGWESGTSWALVAAALGASVIEKSLTLDRSLGGPLDAWSLEPSELEALAIALGQLPAAIAPQGPRFVLPEELEVLGDTAYCLVAKRDLRRGALLRGSQFKAKAGMDGVSPRLLTWIEGRRLLYDLAAGEALTLGLIE